MSSIKVYLNDQEYDALRIMLHGGTGSMSRSAFRLLPFTRYRIDFIPGTSNITLYLNDVQFRVYRNLGSDFTFLYTWKHHIV